MKPNVYLASGWFNPEQKKQMEEIYEVLSALEGDGKISLFAPFYDGIVLKKDDPNIRCKMKEVWDLDISKLEETDLVVAGTQDNDVGTIFECGYASRGGTTILCYNSKPEYGLNVMLSQEARGFVKTKEQLYEAMKAYLTHVKDWQPEKKSYVAHFREWRWNLWEGAPV